MEDNLIALKNYIEQDIKSKSIDFFSKLTIEKTFISTQLISEENINYSYEDMLNNLLNNVSCEFVILGNGGLGKTHFLKKIYFDLYSKNKFPIYVSLQDYGNWEKSNNKDIVEYIYYKTGFNFIKTKTKIISEFNYSKSDYFLLLDGADEYNGNIQNLLNNQIFQNKIDCNVVITSRNTHAIYFRNFKTLYLNEISEEQIKKYLLMLFEKQKAEILLIKIKQREDIYNLVKIPLFLALLCSIYKNNPNNIDVIHSKSDFIIQIFDDICNNKFIQQDERTGLLNEYYKIAFDLKHSKQIEPSENAKKLQLLIPSNNSYQFIHKLFEDYYCAKYVSQNKTRLFFLNPYQNNFKIFDKNWKQTIIFWFGTDNVCKNEKLKLFNAIYKFKDKTSGWYKKQAFLLCCEILNEFKDCPIGLQEKLLNILIQETKFYYSLTDEEELQRKKSINKTFNEQPYILNLANAIFTTNRKLFSEILFSKLKSAWNKHDNNAPLTTYISRLADLQYNTYQFRDLLIEIYKDKYVQFSYDLYAKAFGICAYNDNEIMLFFLEKLENPKLYEFDKEKAWIVFDGIIAILNKIIPSGSYYLDRLFNLLYNNAILNQYGINKQMFINCLVSLLKKKLDNQEKLLEIKKSFPNKNALANLIKNYIDNNNQEILTDIAINLKRPFANIQIDLRQALKSFDIQRQKDFLKIILLDERFVDMQKCIICILADNIYKESSYILNLFNEVKNNNDHILYQNILYLSYVVAMCSDNNEVIKEAINILKNELTSNSNDNEIIRWLGGILQQQKSYKNEIIGFLKSINPIENEAIFEKIFYTTLEDENKIEFKRAYMNAILNKDNKKNRNNLLYNLYLNSVGCSNNDEVIDFCIKLVKNLPLKNNLYLKFIIIKSRFYARMSYALIDLKNKASLKCVKQAICILVNNTFVKMENNINNKYFNYPFHCLGSVLVSIIQPKDYEKVLKQLKNERYGPVLSFLAYEIPYLDCYKIYHPIKYNIIEYRKITAKHLKSMLNLLIKFYSNYKDLINNLLICLFVIFYITIFLKEQDKPLSFTNYAKTFIHKQIKDYE